MVGSTGGEGGSQLCSGEHSCVKSPAACCRGRPGCEKPHPPVLTCHQAGAAPDSACLPSSCGRDEVSIIDMICSLFCCLHTHIQANLPLSRYFLSSASVCCILHFTLLRSDCLITAPVSHAITTSYYCSSLLHGSQVVLAAGAAEPRS